MGDYRRTAMNIDPDQIRADIDALLAQLPQAGGPENPDDGPSLAELEEIARRLSEAHDVLLQALESAEKG
jgi:hypothetical protein